LSFLRPNYAKAVADVVKELGGIPFLTDCNTLYVGRRKHALEHLEAAQENGFSPLSTGCQIIIADGLKETGNNVDFDKGNVKLCDYNLTQLRQLKKVKDEAKRMMFLSVILLIIGFLAVKKRRMYECVVWGGVAASVIGIVSLILLAVSGSGIFYGVREMVFKGRYDVFFSGDDRLIALIPDNLGLRMFLIYTGVILAGLVITIIVRLISWRKTQPHKF